MACSSKQCAVYIPYEYYKINLTRVFLDHELQQLHSRFPTEAYTCYKGMSIVSAVLLNNLPTWKANVYEFCDDYADHIPNTVGLYAELELPFGSKVLANSYSTVYENLISLKTKYRLTWSNFNWFVYLPDLTQIILKAGHLSFIIRQTKSFWFLSLLNSRHYNCDMSKHRGSEWDSPDSIFRMSSFFRYNFLIIVFRDKKRNPYLVFTTFDELFRKSKVSKKRSVLVSNRWGLWEF